MVSSHVMLEMCLVLSVQWCVSLVMQSKAFQKSPVWAMDLGQQHCQNVLVNKIVIKASLWVYLWTLNYQAICIVWSHCIIIHTSEVCKICTYVILLELSGKRWAPCSAILHNSGACDSFQTRQGFIYWASSCSFLLMTGTLISWKATDKVSSNNLTILCSV